MQEHRFGGDVETHVDQAQLFQSFHSLAGLDQGGQIGSRVAVLDGDGGDFRFDALQELDQAFHLSLETDIFQNQGMEIVLVHFDELANEIGGEVVHIFNLEGLDIVTFEMAFSVHWAVGVFQEITSLGFEMGQNELFDHQVLPAFLLDRFFLGLRDVIVAINY